MAAFQAMGTSPERRDRLNRSEMGLVMIRAETLKKKGSKPSDTEVFLGSNFRSSFSTSDKLCSGVKEGEASG